MSKIEASALATMLEEADEKISRLAASPERLGFYAERSRLQGQVIRLINGFQPTAGATLETITTIAHDLLAKVNEL